jgi:hypothetical protein
MILNIEKCKEETVQSQFEPDNAKTDDNPEVTDSHKQRSDM